MILFCIFFIANIGRDIASREIHLYYSTITALMIISAIIPVLYSISDHILANYKAEMNPPVTQ